MGAPLRTLLAPVVAVAAMLVGCDDGAAGDAERFCGEVQANREAVVAPQLATPEDIDALLVLYRDIGELAPLAVAEDWEAVTLAYETAATMEPGNAESEQRAMRQAFASERSATAIRDWLLANCAIDIGPVATVLPPPAPTLPGGSLPADTGATDTSAPGDAGDANADDG